MVIRKSATFLHRLFWTATVIVLFVVAIYVSLGRYYMDKVDDYQQQLVARLVEFTGLQIKVGRLYGAWSGIYPTISFEQVTLLHPENTDQSVLFMAEVNFTIDPLATLLKGDLQANGLSLSGVKCVIEEFAAGKWRLQGYPYQSGDTNVENIIERILLFDNVNLDDVELALLYANGYRDQIKLNTLSLVRSGDFRRARLQLVLDQSLEPIRVLVESTGDPRNSDVFSAEAYASFKQMDFTAQLPLIHSLGLQLRDARINSELWGHWLPGGEISLEGDIAIPLLDLAAITGKEIPDVENFSSRFKVKRTADEQWSAWIANIAGEIKSEQFEVDQLTVGYQHQQLSLAAQSLSLDEITLALLELAVLEGDGPEILSTLSPGGRLNNLQLQLDLSPETERLFLLEANLDKVSVQPWHGSPGATAVSGFIHAEPDFGSVVLDAKEFTMEFPDIYHQPLQLGQARAQLQWRMDGKHVYVNSGLIHLRSDHGPVTALLRLDIPVEKAAGEPQMTLVIGLSDIDAGLRGRYIPYILSNDLLDWLGNSIRSGHITDGGFIYRGSLVGDAPEDRTVQLYLNVEGASLDYHSDWPAVDNLAAMVVIDDDEVDVTTTAASIFGLAVTDAVVALDPLDQGSWLTINAGVHGSITDAMRIVTRSPGLRRYVGAAFDHWQLSGDIEAELQLGIPLANETVEAKVAFESRLSQGELDISDFNLQLKQFSGPLGFSTEKGFYSAGIVGKFFGERAKLSVRQQPGQPLLVSIAGRLAMADVAAWTGQPVMMFFSGKTQFQVDASIGEDSSRLTMSSDLVGVKVDLPSPYNKSAEQAWGFQLAMPIGVEPILLEMSIENTLELQLQLADRVFQNALLSVGGSSAISREDGTFIIAGQLESASLEQWRPYYDRYIQAMEASAQESDVTVKVREFDIAQLEAFSSNYRDMRVDLRRQKAYWRLGVNNQDVEGLIFIPVDSEKPWHLVLDRFVLAKSSGNDDELDTGVFRDLDPATLFDVDVKVKELFIAEEPVGNVAFSLRSEKEGVRIDQLIGEIRNMTIGSQQHPGQLSWFQTAAGNRTELQARFGFRNLADVFERWDYERMIESKKGYVMLDLSWSARPDQWTLNISEGKFNLEIDDGRFLKTSGGAAGTMKIISIFNVSNILRRLQLDFSDLSGGGVSFDDMEGGFEINNAYLDITDPLLIHSPSSQFVFDGGTDLNTEKLDMELIATLPVAGNLPWVAAAFLGGLPVAAGVYIATKVFKSQVDKVSSAVYTLRGNWDDPDLEFKKLYAGDLSKKLSKKSKKNKKEKQTEDVTETETASPE